MANKWWGKQDADEDEKKETKDEGPPKEFTEKLGKIDGLETSVNELKTKAAVLDRMSTYLDEQDNLKKEARKKEAETLAAKATETQDETWMTDPQKAFDNASLPMKIALANSHSLHLRKEVLEDGEFEYYTGEFKKEVDSLIDTGLNVTAKVDPQAIKNCYYLVLGRKQKEIREGKLKSRFADASTSRATDGKGKEGSDALVTLTDAEKSAARKLGIPEDKYAKNLKEMNIAI